MPHPLAFILCHPRRPLLRHRRRHKPDRPVSASKRFAPDNRQIRTALTVHFLRDRGGREDVHDGRAVEVEGGRGEECEGVGAAGGCFWSLWSLLGDAEGGLGEGWGGSLR